jgi:hypothetical protein
MSAFAGCGSGADSLMPVRGKVSYRGNLLTSGTIVFCPDAERGTEGNISCAEIAPDGGYSLKTGDQEGIAPGWYRVTVAALVGSGPYDPRSVLPEKYRDPQLSGLQCQIKLGHDNVVDFELE